ncbi:MAG: hypothetical protein Q7S60_03200 [bacterium]|nr:hypothetical protein [bacterium]
METRRSGMTGSEQILYLCKDLVRDAARRANAAGALKASSLTPEQVLPDGNRIFCVDYFGEVFDMSPGGTFVGLDGNLYHWLGLAADDHGEFTPADWRHYGPGALEAIEKMIAHLGNTPAIGS